MATEVYEVVRRTVPRGVLVAHCGVYKDLTDAINERQRLENEALKKGDLYSRYCIEQHFIG